MKKILLAISVVLALTASAQNDRNDTIYNGIGKLQLGKARSALPNLSPVPGSAFTRTPKNGYDYSYRPSSGVALSIPGLVFPTAIVSFDKQDQVSLFRFVKTYSLEKDANSNRAAKRDYKNLLNHLLHRFNTNGEAKEYSKKEGFVQYGTEWQNPASFVKLSLEENSSNSTTTITLSFTAVPFSR